MTEGQFQHAVRLGLGRGILFAREHDVRGFRDVILDACLHCYSYDIQVEGTRAAYMYDLVRELPDKDFYYGQVLESLAGSGEDWHALQRSEFAERLAADGNEEAKRLCAREEPETKMEAQTEAGPGGLAASPKIPATYEELLNTTPWPKALSWLRWGEQASEEELAFAAQGLIAAKDTKQQLAHLRIFGRRRFPLDPSPIVALVGVEEDRVGFAAMQALGHIEHPVVREVALRSIAKGAKWRGESIALIAANFEPGDHRMVLRWFREEEDADTLHSLEMDLMKFWERHADEETVVEMLRVVYEKGPCSVCRRGAVRRLISRGALGEELRAECAWDSNDDIRDLVRQS